MAEAEDRVAETCLPEGQDGEGFGRAHGQLTGGEAQCADATGRNFSHVGRPRPR